MNDKPKALVVACKGYFGQHDGQTLIQFRDEVKELDQEERTWFAKELGRELGCEVDGSTKAA